MHHVILSVHASYSSFCSIFFCANLHSVIGFVFVSFLYLLCVLGPYSSIMPRKTRANMVSSTPSMSPSRVQLFKNDRCCEAFEKLNSKRKFGLSVL